MTVLSVPGIHCQMCVNRITKALTAAGFPFQVSLEDKTVSVGGENVAEATEILGDLGFDVA